MPLTGYYISETDLYPYMPKTEIDAVTENISDEPEVTNIQQIIINRCGFANAKLANRYEVPFVEGDDHITDALKQNIAYLCVYDITQLFQSVSDNVMKIREGNFKQAIKFFEALRDGKEDLITELDADGDKVDRYYFDSNQRIDRNFH